MGRLHLHGVCRAYRNEYKPSLEKGINGGWLVAVVATQSVCVLGCTLGGAVLVDREAALFTLMAFSLGGGCSTSGSSGSSL